MSKHMTPCEKLGYKVGDEFTVVEDSYKFGVGSVISLQEDGGTEFPYFTNEIVKHEYPAGVACYLHNIKMVEKLKPAKQALADAIHQNGGWTDGAAAAVFGKKTMRCVFLKDFAMPIYYNPHKGSWSIILQGIISSFKMKPFINWHQTILYRDEYFYAYPEQVNVEVNNETERNVEVEMKSEPEMTIKSIDWHKNGELPPVGEVCEALVYEDDLWSEIEIISHMDEIAIGWCRKDKCAYHCGDPSCFRPLRTERDKAIDEMIKVGGLRARDGAREVFGRLYDAGMYKEAKL